MPTSLSRRPLIILVALTLLLALSVTVSTPTARATDPLTVTGGCESGLSHFHCDAVVSGGIAPYTYSWQALTNAAITSSATNPWMTGSCTGSWFTVQVTVRDSVDTTVIQSFGTTCRPGHWE